MTGRVSVVSAQITASLLFPVHVSVRRAVLDKKQTLLSLGALIALQGRLPTMNLDANLAQSER